MHILWRGSALQRVRLGCGLVLFVFVAAHFVNHALGLVSLHAMLVFDAWRTAATRSLVGGLVLLAALLAHAALALWKLVRRRTLKLPAWELWQIGLGLAIPFLLLPHIVNTRVSSLFYGINTTYPYELLRIWGESMLQQAALLLLVWLHGCIGLHFWLRLAPGYRRVAPWLLALAVLLPFAALAGVIVQGRGLSAEVAADPVLFAALKTATNWPGAALADHLAALRYRAPEIFLAILAVVALILAVRLFLRRRAHRIPIQYVAGPLVKTEQGPTLLEVSRMHGIPHMSVCGGRARCSTCRVLVLSNDSGLQPPSAAEMATLKSIGAGSNVRLACQARPKHDMTVMRLLQAHVAAPASSFLAGREFAGVERDLAVLFVDIRGFTRLTESKLAFDVVFILNQFFAAVGRPIYDVGGWINDYFGDGLLALFADRKGIGDACRSALLAAAEIDRAVDALNVLLATELDQPLRVAMGLHAGPHVVGRLGFGDTPGVSVIGPAVNIASRLESVAKEKNVQLVLSETVALHARLDVRHLAIASIEIRGSSMPMRAVVIDRARHLIEALGAAQAIPEAEASRT